MTAYLCTYRHFWPTEAQKRRTAEKAENNPLLKKFLESYDKSFFDWGDDPSFFSAQNRLNNVNCASWGVCRRDVRSTLAVGDLVVFFCGRQRKDKSAWDYYFIGYGTVKRCVERRELWTDSMYKRYRDFYNVLARWDGNKFVQHEYFHPFHKDWANRPNQNGWKTGRGAAPYIIFDPKLSAFNITSPHKVATWDSGAKPPEDWNRTRRSRQLEELLFLDREINDRKLRTSMTGYGHTKLNLTSRGRVARRGLGIEALREALKPLVGAC